MKDSAQALKEANEVSTTTQPKLVSVNSLVKPVNGNGDEHAKMVEELATRMRATDNIETFAIDYSVLQDEAEVGRMEYTHWKYYLLWLPMFLVACYMMVKVALYRIVMGPIRSLLIDRVELAEVQLIKPREGLSEIFYSFMYLFIWKPIGNLVGSEKTSKERLLLGPKKGTVLFDAFDSVGHLLRNGVTTSLALDILYNLQMITPWSKGSSQWLCDFWLNQPDGHGVRNRAKVVYLRLYNELLNRLADSEQGGEVKLLALACGSAQVDIEAISKLKVIEGGGKVSATLVDLNQTSLQMAQRLAESRGVMSQLDIRLENLKTYLATQLDNSWDVVEMVGFLDYRNDRSVQDMCHEIRRVLKPGGVFITSSICPSLWSFEVRWVINWPLLVRRSKEEFSKLLRAAWCEDDSYELRYVPTKTHVVAVLTKKF